MSEATAAAAAGSRPSMVLRPIAVQCAAGECPTVYASDRDTFVVQGVDLAPDEVGLAIPAGERLVEIPRSLLERVVPGLAEGAPAPGR